MDKKKAEFGFEPLDKTRIVIVDPRRTVTVNACEVEAGKDNVMHLAHQLRHGPGAVQCVDDLHRRQGMDGQGLHRRLDERFRQDAGGQQGLA